MSSAAVNDWIALLRQQNLLKPEQLSQLGELQTRFATGKELAVELVRRKWLTTYQANKLLHGLGQELVLGPYLILEKVGTGNMGRVYKAMHRRLGRTVALKVIRKERQDKDSTRQRFVREIEAVSRLNHPNVVRAYYADQVGDHFYLAMEYVRGSGLGRVVLKHGPLPVAQACAFVGQAARGLQHAHENGLVHRDVKPDNLLVTPDGQVKVLDLGLARIHEPEAGASGSHLTSVGSVVGTPDFISPEQSRNSHTVDHRTDVYSLGCTLYFLLTGQVPFPGGGPVEKLIAHRRDEPRPAEQLRPEVPAGLAAVIRKLMAKQPEDRYQTAGEVTEALRPFCETGGAAAPEPPREKDTMFQFHLDTMTLPKPRETNPEITGIPGSVPDGLAAASDVMAPVEAPASRVPMLLLSALLVLAAAVLGGFLALQLL